MAKGKIACPKCRNPIHIPQALPARIQCPTCQKILNISGPKGSSQAIKPGRAAGPAQAAQLIAAPPAAAPAPLPVAASPAPSFPDEERSGSGLMLFALGGAGLLVVAALAVGAVMFFGNSGGNTTASINNYDGDGDIPSTILDPTTKADPRVTAAVQKGVAYLKRKILSEEKLYYSISVYDQERKYNRYDPHVGALALAGLTLLECDVPPTDAAVVSVTKHVTGAAPAMHFTYSVALSILYLDRLVAVKTVPAKEKSRYKTVISDLALQLIAAQLEGGGWTYNCKPLAADEKRRLTALLNNNRFRPGKFSVRKQWDGGMRDNSIAQFVVLALWNARKHGVPVTRSLIEEEKRYLKEQYKNGSWVYRNHPNPQFRVDTGRDATTCAGLIGLAVGKAIRIELSEAKKQAQAVNKAHLAQLDASMGNGLTYIGQAIGKKDTLSEAAKQARQEHTRRLDTLKRKFMHLDDQDEKEFKTKVEVYKQIGDLDNNELATGILFQADSWGDLYFLWSVERVAVIYGKDKIGGKDWYNWGKEVILKNQVTKPNDPNNGSWHERFPGVPDTCFALLFLRRANIVKDLTDKLKQLLSAAIGGQNRPPLPPRRNG